jgi:hypothetical protein
MATLKVDGTTKVTTLSDAEQPFESVTIKWNTVVDPIFPTYGFAIVDEGRKPVIGDQL